MREKLIEILGSVQYNDNGSTIGNNFQSRFVERIADHLIANDVAPVVRCEACQDGEPCEVNGKVWCKKMGRYMPVDGFCSSGAKMDNYESEE